MKATGIVRRIDDLGRVVIPKEIRRTLRIREGDPLEIFVDREGEVILKKYSPISELGDFSQEYAEALAENTDRIVLITDRDAVISVSGLSSSARRDFEDRHIGDLIEKAMDHRQTVKSAEEKLDLMKGMTVDGESIVAPVVAGGDPLGAVVLLAKEGKISEVDTKLAETAAGFLSRHME